MAAASDGWTKEKDMTAKESDLEKVRKILRQKAAATPPRRQPTAFETISALLPDIVDLKKKRYSDEEICRYVGEAGIVMSLGTFRQYVSRAKIAQARSGEDRRERIGGTRSIAAAKPRQTSGAQGSSPGGEPKLRHRLDDEL
jgi:hypothetical protein